MESKLKTADQLKAAKTVFDAITYVETIRPVVNRYQKEILKRYKWCIDQQWTEYYPAHKIILDPKETYLLSDKDAKIYFDECNIEAKKHGFNVKLNYCPLLIAEDMLRKAKRALIDIWEPATGISNHDVLLIKNREKYVDILLKMAAVSQISTNIN